MSGTRTDVTEGTGIVVAADASAVAVGRSVIAAAAVVLENLGHIQTVTARPVAVDSLHSRIASLGACAVIRCAVVCPCAVVRCAAVCVRVRCVRPNGLGRGGVGGSSYDVPRLSLEGRRRDDKRGSAGAAHVEVVKVDTGRVCPAFHVQVTVSAALRHSRTREPNARVSRVACAYRGRIGELHAQLVLAGAAAHGVVVPHVVGHQA